MAGNHRKLDALLTSLTQTGGDPQRIDIVRRALNFKRAWVELAEGLARLQHSRAYEAWGYPNLQDYCATELHLKPATTDKLLLSLSTVRDHAPEVLQGDGGAVDVPSLDAVDYFARALDLTSRAAEGDVPQRLDAPDDLMQELRTAVFEEGQSVGELRKRFNPVLKPKPEAQRMSDDVKKTRAAALKLLELVRNFDGLAEKRVARIEAAVDALLRDLDRMEPAPDADSGVDEAAPPVEA